MVEGGMNFGDLLFVFLIANFLPAGLGTIEEGDCLPYSPILEYAIQNTKSSVTIDKTCCPEAQKKIFEVISFIKMPKCST